MNRLPRYIERKVLDMYVAGDLRDHIATELHISPAAVTEIESILPPIFEELRDLNKELERENMSAHDTRQGVAIYEKLKKLGIKPEQVDLAIQAVTRMATDAEYKPKTVVQAATRLVELEHQSGRNYKEAIEHLENVIQKGKNHEENNAQLQITIKENRERVKCTFEAANEAPEEIYKFKKEKEKLAENGIDLEDIHTIHNLLESIEDIKNDPREMVELVKVVGPLRKACTILKSEKTKLISENAFSKTQHEIADQSLSQKKKQIDDLDQEIRFKQIILIDKYREIAFCNSQLSQIESKYTQIDDLRKAAISQFARMVGMSDSEIEDLQLKAEVNLFEAAMKNRLNLIIRTIGAEALADLMIDLAH